MSGSEEAASPSAEAVAEARDEQPDVEEYEVDVIDDSRSVERRIEDASLEARVRLALVDSKPLRPFNFEPEAQNGRVVLRGEVSSAELRQQAASVAGGVEGVREVVNEVTADGAPPIAQADTRAPAETEPEESEPEETEPEEPEREEPPVKAPVESDEPKTAETSPPSSRPNWVIRGVWRDPEKPAAPPVEAEEEVEPEGQFHTVRSGDNLWTISRRYGVGIDDIRRLNDLRSNALRPGQKLRVK